MDISGKSDTMKRKVIRYFMFIILLTLGLVLVSFGIGIKNYFYQNISNTFRNYAQAVSPIWTRQADYSSINLVDFSDEIIQNYQYDGADLYLLNRKGQFIQSSLGYYKDSYYEINPSVLSFKTVYQVERNKDYKEKVMVVYTPLIYEGHVMGVLRYVTSLEIVDSIITRFVIYGCFVCGVIAVLVFLISIQLGNSIVDPLKNIICLTKRMAEGRYEEKIEQIYPYEAGELVAMLNYMGDEITKADRLKNEFISSISHELRTPLTGIKGWIETMQEPEGILVEDMKFGMTMIHNETQRLIHLVETLLDFSRYQSDRMNLNPTLIDINDVLNEVVFQMQKMAEQKQVRIILSSSPNVIEADADKIKQVILNILDNAIKFSKEQGKVYMKQAKKDNQIEIIISDQGIGIPPEEMEHITRSFYKLNSKIVGEGLGLAISQKILELHHGTLEIKSEYGKSTSVIITLPLQLQRLKEEK